MPKSLYKQHGVANSQGSVSTTSKDAKYNPNDCDSDDDEFTDEQRVEFLNNLVVEHERLIKSYMKDHDILEAHKNKIYMLNVEKTNLLEKVRFLKSEYHSLLEKNNAHSRDQV